MLVHTRIRRPGARRWWRCLGILIFLLGLPAWSAPLKIDLFDGLSNGSLADGQFGWSRSEKDSAQPEWWVKYQAPETGASYLEIFQDVWGNGPNLTVTRELRVDEGLKSWQIDGRLKVVNGPENSIYLRVFDNQGRAIASLDRFTLNHKQGKRGPGDSYLTFNGTPIIPKARDKEQWKAVMLFTNEAWKPFRITWSAEKPELLTLTYGERTVEAPVPDGVQASSPKKLQLFLGWGLGAQGKGALLLEGLTITAERMDKAVQR